MTGAGAPSGAATVEVLDPRLGAQAYELTIGPDGITLAHGDDAGLRYGRATLSQVRAQADDGLPGLDVRDRPDLATRGFMLDISRNRVPTRETLERLVGLLSAARYTQLQLYTEHTFAFRDHEVVWRDASPMTPDDVAWLDGRCAAEGIELVTNQNCFGHMERWLRHDDYRDRAEAPEGFEIMAGVRMPPSVLEPTEANAAFAREIVREALACTAAAKVNIGCDEPFELGQGRSRDAVTARGREAVFLDHVRRIMDPLLADGIEVQMWADVLRGDPSLAPEVPDGSVPVVWCYEAAKPDDRKPALPPELRAVFDSLGMFVDVDGFAPVLEPVAATGIRHWVAPGTSSWNSLVGRIDNAAANVVEAAEAARASGAEGYLVTDWGDNGHLQPPSVSFGPLLFAGAVSWGLDANRDLDLAALLDTHAFADASGRLGAAVDGLGRLWAATGRNAANASPLHAAAFPAQAHLVTGRPDADAVAEVVERLDEHTAAVLTSTPGCVDAEAVRHEVVTAARLARRGAVAMLERLAAPVPGPGPADDGEPLVDAQRTAWLARARPGGMDDSLALVAAATATPTA